MKNQTAYIVRGLFIIAQLLLFTILHAATYYFSSSLGNDNYSSQQARSASTPWQSLNKLNGFFVALLPGDSILFRRGDIFYGYLQVTVSGNAAAPVVLAAYGNGNTPVISGFTTLTDWSPAGNGIWEVNVPSPPDMVHSVVVNGTPEAIGRYPNASDSNSGYLTIDGATGSSSISGPQLPSSSGWTDADVVIRKTHWVLDRNQITGVSGKTIQYTSESGYGAAENYGYFVQNHPATLDKPCEWYYNRGTHKLGMFFGTAGVAGFIVEASTTDRLITLNAQSYITFNGLVLKGANEYAFDINQAHNIQLKNCSILYTGNTAVHTTQSQFIRIENLTIDQTNNIACDISNTSNLTIINNIVSNTGTIAGSGKGDSGSYEAFLLSGDNQVIEGNTISNTGYVPLTFNGNHILIRNNFISGFGFVKDDGGGIYTWNNASNPPIHIDRSIAANIVLEGIGAPDGTADKKRLIHGIYMDDNTDQVTISANTVADCGMYGIYIHNAHDLILDSNTVFNNQTQIAMIHDNIAPLIPLKNISFTHNTSFSKTAEQPVAIFNSIGNDLANIGTLDYNYYCRPLDEQSPIGVTWNSGGGLYDLNSWQQLFNKDAHSKKTPVTIAQYRINGFAGANMYGNGSFNSNINNVNVFAAAANFSDSWSNTSPLDGGALKLSFNSVSGNSNHGSVIIGVGAIDAGKNYILRYDVSGAVNRYIESYLRKSLSPYTDLSARKLNRVYNTRTPCESLFTAGAAEGNTSVGLDIGEQANPLYIDNLQLYEAQVTITNPDDSIRFVYNKTSSVKSYSLDGNYIDVRGNAYAGNISLPPFGSAILIKKPLVLLPVVFSSFKATKYEQKVNLQWTISDTGPGTIQQVERSGDGLHFKTIGEQPALPSSGTADYSFADNTPIAEDYYRIVYINEDNSSSYSNILHVHFPQLNAVSEENKLQISPNPATDKLQIRYDNTSFTSCMVVLKTITGSTLQSILLDRPVVTMDISALSNGIYVISVITNSRVISKYFEKV